MLKKKKIYIYSKLSYEVWLTKWVITCKMSTSLKMGAGPEVNIVSIAWASKTNETKWHLKSRRRVTEWLTVGLIDAVKKDATVCWCENNGTRAACRWGQVNTRSVTVHIKATSDNNKDSFGRRLQKLRCGTLSKWINMKFLMPLSVLVAVAAFQHGNQWLLMYLARECVCGLCCRYSFLTQFLTFSSLSFSGIWREGGSSHSWW